MKKIIILIVAALSMLLVSSCTISAPLSFIPSSMSLKVGESQSFSIEVGDRDGSLVKYGLVSGSEKFISLKGMTVTGLAEGNGEVGLSYFGNGLEQQPTETVILPVTVKK